jgi:exopolysaccharide biosynthesis polyprenyl glycosylphosphotransferase
MSKGRSRSRWPYRHQLMVVDVLAASIAAFTIYAARKNGYTGVSQQSHTGNILTVLMPVVWVLSLQFHKAYDCSSVDHAAKARGRVLQAALTLIATMWSACLALHYTALTYEILVGVPLAAILTVLLRQLAVRWWRARGGEAYLRRAIIVGPVTPVGGLIAAMGRDRTHDLRVVAACLADGATDDQLAALPVPVYGDLSDVPGTARAAGCDTVIVSPCAQLDPIQIRRLGWELHDAGIELLVAPALSEVARERVEALPAGGVPLLHVRTPVLSGPERILKGFLDRIAAVVLLVLAAPVMITVAVLIRATSTGPALFRQRRVGRAGTEFTCLKFRTMTVDAEARRHELTHLNERRDGLLFKIRHDPRITRIGAVLRKYSIDELPQLINVVFGDMSLVGPRPPLPQEVAGYDDAMRRRLLVKPGLTGLWQISGRSDLTWDESVRLDLRYVENWSLTLDLMILWKTAFAVVGSSGAY